MRITLLRRTKCVLLQVALEDGTWQPLLLPAASASLWGLNDGNLMLVKILFLGSFQMLFPRGRNTEINRKCFFKKTNNIFRETNTKICHIWLRRQWKREMMRKFRLNFKLKISPVEGLLGAKQQGISHCRKSRSKRNYLQRVWNASTVRMRFFFNSRIQAIVLHH